MKVLLEKNLKTHLKWVLPEHPVRDVYEYAVLPPGKLFRPRLVAALALDISSGQVSKEFECPDSSLSLLASAIEIHHAYTLVHDDLPSMDNDDFRRGKPSCHKAFTEWKALLAGDGLLSASYALLSKMPSPYAREVFRFFSWATGPKGLIQGQVLDLSHEMNQNFSTLCQTHLYKTARLIQCSLYLSFILSQDYWQSPLNPWRAKLDIFKLGQNLGLCFQFLDDLSELTEKDLSAHESTINPWLGFHEKSHQELIKNINSAVKIIDQYNLDFVGQEFSGHLGTMLNLFIKGMPNIQNHFENYKVEKKDLTPLMMLLDGLDRRNHT